MTRPSALPRNESSRRSASESLAALIGHQLNNIVVPLDGFAELALQNMAADDHAREDLSEMRIAIGRIKELALELQGLGESDSQPKRVAIGACIPAAVAHSIAAPWTIEWLCSASTAITVDVLHAQHAIHSLARLARADAATSTPFMAVSLELQAGVRCTACGALFARKHRSVWVHCHSARPLQGQDLRKPFGLATRGRGEQSLTLAVLVHCAHLAGGHVLLDEPSRRISLAFPRASD